MIGYCVSLILIIIFSVLSRSGNLATGIILGELSVSNELDCYESSSSSLDYEPLRFLLFGLMNIILSM